MMTGYIFFLPTTLCQRKNTFLLGSNPGRLHSKRPRQSLLHASREHFPQMKNSTFCKTKIFLRIAERNRLTSGSRTAIPTFTPLPPAIHLEHFVTSFRSAGRSKISPEPNNALTTRLQQEQNTRDIYRHSFLFQEKRLIYKIRSE